MQTFAAPLHLRLPKLCLFFCDGDYVRFVLGAPCLIEERGGDIYYCGRDGEWWREEIFSFEV